MLVFSITALPLCDIALLKCILPCQWHQWHFNWRKKRKNVFKCHSDGKQMPCVSYFFKSCTTVTLFNCSAQIFSFLEQSVHGAVIHCTYENKSESSFFSSSSFDQMYRVHPRGYIIHMSACPQRICLYNSVIQIIWDKLLCSDSVDNIWCTEKYWL